VLFGRHRHPFLAAVVEGSIGMYGVAVAAVTLLPGHGSGRELSWSL